jgi:putative flippase GtrA
MPSGEQPEPLPSPDVIEPPATTPGEGSSGRIRVAFQRRSNWEQLGRFCVVGLSGYLINLGVYAFLQVVLDVHYLPAAVGSFLVAVASNYTWNRLWTFRGQRGHVAYQGIRFLVVSTAALGANLVVLYILVEAGLAALPAQAIAIVVVTPLNFIGNKLWSFRR